MGPQEVGVMLTLSAVEERHQKLVDDSGMSGSGGRIHLHSNQAADMYKGQEQEFVFDIQMQQPHREPKLPLQQLR